MGSSLGLQNCKVWNIVKSTGGYKKDDITISRIAAYVPHWIAYFYLKRLDKVLVDMDLIETFCNVRLPNFMKSNMIPPLIPKIEGYENLLTYYYVFSYLLDAVKNPKNAATHEKAVSDIETCVNAALNSQFIPSKMRVELMLNFGLVENNEKRNFNKEMLKLGSNCADLWRIICSSKDRKDALATINLRTLSKERPTPPPPIRYKITFQNHELTDMPKKNLIDAAKAAGIIKKEFSQITYSEFLAALDRPELKESYDYFLTRGPFILEDVENLGEDEN